MEQRSYQYHRDYFVIGGPRRRIKVLSMAVLPLGSKRPRLHPAGSHVEERLCPGSPLGINLDPFVENCGIMHSMSWSSVLQGLAA